MLKGIPPKISVLMPIYQGDDHLVEAVESILNQTFSDFEFLIICDDPTDETHEILDTYMQKDARVKVYYNQKREGLVNSLNKGIALAQGEYIARMDADDISLPDRFKKQVRFMDGNPQIGLCGSYIQTIGSSFDGVYTFPLKDEEIRASIFFGWSIAHPVVFIQKEILKKITLWYDSDYKYCEDYEFWSRLKNITSFSTIPEVLLYYRVHNSNICKLYNEEQKKLTIKIRKKMIEEFGIYPEERQLTLFNKMCEYEYIYYRDLYSLKELLNTLLTINKSKGLYSKKIFTGKIKKYWYSACFISLLNHDFQNTLLNSLRNIMKKHVEIIHSVVFKYN